MGEQITKNMPVLCQLPWSSQPRLSQGARPGVASHRPARARVTLLLCAEEIEPWLTAQGQTEK